MSMSIYYHYTDREGLIGILKSRKIRKSVDGRFGPGVYFTSLSPKHGRRMIARNNWDGIWLTTELAGKVNYTVSVSLPDHRMKMFTQKDRKGRVAEIFLFKKDVYLDETTYKLYSKRGDHRELQKKYDHEVDSSSSSSEDEEDSTSSEDEEDSTSSEDEEDSTSSKRRGRRHFKR